MGRKIGQAAATVVLVGVLTLGMAPPLWAAPPSGAPLKLQCQQDVSYKVLTPDRPRTYVVVHTKHLNVRVEPGVGCAMLGKVKKGKRLRGTGKRAKVGKVLWRQVASPFGISWVAASYLKAK